VVNSRVQWAQRFALAALVVIVIYHIDEVMKASGGSGYLPIANPMLKGALFGIPTLGLSTISFLLSWQRASFTVSIILLVGGGLMVADGIMIGTRYLTVLTLPGPLIGLLYGLVVLSIGIIKASLTVAIFKKPAEPDTMNDKAKKSKQWGTAMAEHDPNES
jgi:hypothetical protein